MAAPDYDEAVLNARSAQRDRFAPGTRIVQGTHPRAGTVCKLHVGTLKRQKRLSQWAATVRWDDGSTTIGILLTDLRPEAEPACEFCRDQPVANAASWADGEPRPAAACPRCGVTTPYTVVENTELPAFQVVGKLEATADGEHVDLEPWSTTASWSSDPLLIGYPDGTVSTVNGD